MSIIFVKRGEKLFSVIVLEIFFFLISSYAKILRCGRELLCEGELSWECVCVCLCVLSCVQLFVTPWTIACKSPLSMVLSRQECWSGLPFPSPIMRVESVQFSHSVMSNSLWPHDLQQARPPWLWLKSWAPYC